MHANKEQIINHLAMIKPKLSKNGITQIALFGSYANNSENAYSDIDIAIRKDRLTLDTLSPYLYFEMINFIKSSTMEKFGKNVDVFDLDSTSPFKDAIAKEAIYV